MTPEGFFLHLPTDGSYLFEERGDLCRIHKNDFWCLPRKNRGGKAVVFHSLWKTLWKLWEIQWNRGVFHRENSFSLWKTWLEIFRPCSAFVLK